MTENVCVAVAGPPTILVVENVSTGTNNLCGKLTFKLNRCQTIRILGLNFSPTVRVYLNTLSKKIRWAPPSAQVTRKPHLVCDPGSPYFGQILHAVEICAVPQPRVGPVVGHGPVARGGGEGGPGDESTQTIGNDPPTATGTDTSSNPSDFHPH